MTDRYANIRKALAAYDTHAANGQEVTGRILLFSAMEEACDPDTIRALLAERDALEAAREDAERIEWLERNCVNVADEYGTGSQLYFGTYASGPLRAAIDQARAGRRTRMVEYIKELIRHAPLTTISAGLALPAFTIVCIVLLVKCHD